MFDVIVIGAGVIGTSIARELSKYQLKIGVIEKEADVAMGSTKANSAIVHAGYDAPPDTLKGRLNAKGNAMFDKLSEELEFPFKRNGSFVICFEESEKAKLENLMQQGLKNGVPGMEILTGEKVREMEPNLSEEIKYALYLPSGGIVCPYEMTIALAENAAMNGVTFFLQTKVDSVARQQEHFIIQTNQAQFEARIVINAAGLYADEINNSISVHKLKILPRKGEYCLFDQEAGVLVKHTVFQLPTKLGKGILVTPTVDGNLLVGPNAQEVDDKSDVETTREGIDEILQKAKLTMKQLPLGSVITSFSGLRARLETEDFIIGEQQDMPGFINVAGIQSPGLSSAPAIGLEVLEIVQKLISCQPRENFNPHRTGIPKFREMSNEERQKLIRKDPAFGRIICRCENVTEGEIVRAIHSPLGAKTLDGVKRRTRAGMGRCQSGFCSPRIVDILARELDREKIEITKSGGTSEILIGANKEL